MNAAVILMLNGHGHLFFNVISDTLINVHIKDCSHSMSAGGKKMRSLGIYTWLWGRRNAEIVCKS
jgi:hypothetical protein